MKAFIFAAAVSAALIAGQASAQTMVDNEARATGDVVVATGRFAEASGKLVIGVLALPVILAGKAAEAVGSGVSQSGEAVLGEANGPLAIGGDRWNDRDSRRDDGGTVVVQDDRDRTWHPDRHDW
ncbi:hypothetical protein [Asticcacaulis solisilvae]|uniref:hypothetical protein n=1 Tax=Asticcacaulis solisilvae TaxID=1217274 RepID=UPI003FD6CAA0